VIFITFMWLVGIGLIVLATTLIANYFKGDNAKLRKLARERGVALHEAHAVLRSIANGAGNPQIEAQIALDDYNRKEIL
jgi:hypothetical protein